MCAWQFGDSFDCYAATADAVAGYWDSNVGSLASMGIGTGRFSGSRAVNFGAGIAIVKSSAVNDGVHHFVCAFQQTAAITGSTLATYFQLFDATTAQCSVVFRSDGAILLVNGGPTGTVQATYTGAFPVVNTWYAFEIEVLISNTAGYMNVRKNGNTVNDFTSATNLDTQNSANAYANKLQFGAQSFLNAQWIDDLYWRSDATSLSWYGDIRGYTRAPASDAAVQFSRTPTGVLTQVMPPIATGSSTSAASTTTAFYDQFTASYSGTVTSVAVAATVVGGATNMKCTIFTDNGSGQPGTIIASATPVTPVVSGTHTFTFSPGVTITKGTAYWVGVITDGTTTNYAATGATVAYAAFNVVAYATFPQNNPVVSIPARAIPMTWTYTATPANWQAVSEAQQDTTTSYVYDSVPGHADFYGIAPIASTPLTTFAVTTRAYAIKSDAGTRTAAVQLKSGASTVASPTVVLTTSNWQWAWRHDTVDPQTGTAWTAAAVNLVQCGPVVIA